MVPPSCTVVEDAGINALTTEFSCPQGSALPTNCASHPYPCAPPPTACPQPPAGLPWLFDCSNQSCTEGCGDIPCPSVPCPPSTSSLWTCGPKMPELAPGCVLIATTPGTMPFSDRYSVCCAGY
jgi:hypothetical protein